MLRNVSIVMKVSGKNGDWNQTVRYQRQYFTVNQMVGLVAPSWLSRLWQMRRNKWRRRGLLMMMNYFGVSWLYKGCLSLMFFLLTFFR